MATVTLPKKKKARVKRMTIGEFEKEKNKTWYLKLLEIFRFMGWCSEANVILEEQTRKRKVTNFASAMDCMAKGDPAVYIALRCKLECNNFCAGLSDTFWDAWSATLTVRQERAVIRKYKVKIKELTLSKFQGISLY